MSPPPGSAEDLPPGGMQPGDELKGRYRLVRLIATGQRTEVWTARDELLDRTVLVKFLHLLPDDTRTRQQFHREALGAARLSHPGIVAVYDTILEGETTGLVLEHVQATPLSRFLHDGGSVSADEATSIVRQVADALRAAHETGIRHHNLTPDSVWLCDDQRIKITDFGSAWEGGAGEGALPAAGSDDDAADIRSLGALLQHCLATGEAAGASNASLADFIERALAAGGAEGFASLAEALAHLAEATGQPAAPLDSWGAVATTEPGISRAARVAAHLRRPRRRRALPLIAAAALTALALSLLILTGGDESPPEGAPGIRSTPVAGEARPARAGEGENSLPPVTAGPEAGNPDVDESTARSAAGGDAASDEADDGGTADADPGVAIVEVRITTFRGGETPGDDPDALRTLDGDEATYWATPGVGAGDATVGGVGLEFRLAEPTPVTRMTIISDTTGWVAEAYVGDGGHGSLSDWGLVVDQQTNSVGRMRLDLAGQETGAVLLWIPDPRAAVTEEIRIAEVVISAESGAELR